MKDREQKFKFDFSRDFAPIHPIVPLPPVRPLEKPIEIPTEAPSELIPTCVCKFCFPRGDYPRGPEYTSKYCERGLADLYAQMMLSRSARDHMEMLRKRKER